MVYFLLRILFSDTLNAWYSRKVIDQALYQYKRAGKI
jgi:hypothetical protein